MKKMSVDEIRSSWINFFKSKNHYFLEPASLIPYNDDSLLWINSGVATLKDYFSGKKNPPSHRLVNSQKAIRTNDFFNVGLTSRHQTLFEMLGNFSIGDYFKEQAIEFAYELLMKEWEINLDRLWFTVYQDDEVAFNKWVSLGVKPERILRCDRDRNFWDVGNGPCGPCTEIHYDRGEKYDFLKLGDKLIKEDIENDRYVEIWNIVFSEFNNDGKGNYIELARKNIDTGAGIERIASISQDVPTNFDIDVFQKIILAAQKHSPYKYEIDNYFKKDPEQTKINFAYKVIADHFRAAVFAIADGAIPSNKDRGYVLRRLIRRAMVFAHQLKMDNDEYLKDVVHAVVLAMANFYGYLKDAEPKVLEVIKKESAIFKKTLAQGLKLFEDSIKNHKLDDNATFDLVVTYGFPIELIKEIANERNINVDLDVFDQKFKEHQAVSKSNRQAKAMDQQNAKLLGLDLNSEFLYDVYKLKGKVIKLFDEDFNELQHLVGDGYVVFDKTPFYATSGGQISDTGLINGLYEVDDVQKGPNLQHIHHVIGADLSLGQEVELEINEFNRNRIARNHSAEHLLHASLKKNIDPNLKQEGAFKSPDKVTFDFQYHKKLTDEQLQKVEDWVNEQIKDEHQVEVKNMTLEEAHDAGALAYFGEVYKKIHGKLRVIDMGKNVSMELCGGTHVHNTHDIETFKILDYYSKGSGSWRIEATSTKYNVEQAYEQLLKKINHEFDLQKKIFIKEGYDLKPLDQIINHFNEVSKKVNLFKINQLFNDTKEEINNLKKEASQERNLNQASEIKKLFKEIGETEKKALFLGEIYHLDAIRIALKDLANETNTVYLVFKNEANRWAYFAIVNEKWAKERQLNLNDLISKPIQNSFNAKGGGKPFYNQGGINEEVSEAQLKEFVEKLGFKFA